MKTNMWWHHWLMFVAGCVFILCIYRYYAPETVETFLASAIYRSSQKQKNGDDDIDDITSLGCEASDSAMSSCSEIDSQADVHEHFSGSGSEPQPLSTGSSLGSKHVIGKNKKK
jgi:hypothetical protein